MIITSKRINIRLRLRIPEQNRNGDLFGWLGVSRVSLRVTIAGKELSMILAWRRSYADTDSVVLATTNGRCVLSVTSHDAIARSHTNGRYILPPWRVLDGTDYLLCSAECSRVCNLVVDGLPSFTDCVDTTYHTYQTANDPSMRCIHTHSASIL